MQGIPEANFDTHDTVRLAGHKVRPLANEWELSYQVIGE